MSQAQHNFVEIFSTGEDSPNHSRDSVLYCQSCGTVKRDYRHNGGRTSPNFPYYYTRSALATHTCPPCSVQDVAAELAKQYQGALQHLADK